MLTKTREPSGACFPRKVVATTMNLEEVRMSKYYFMQQFFNGESC